MVEKLPIVKKLDKKLISSYLSSKTVERLAGFDVLKTTTSTNDEVLESQLLQKNRFIVCLADQQTAGRGRNGNVWQSPSAAHIYMSTGSVFDVSLIKDIAGLSLACGVAVVRLLRSKGVKAGLKWPNDVLVDDKKLAGILVETRIRASQVIVVVGLGLNIEMPESAIANIEQPWTDLNSLIPKKDFNAAFDLVYEKKINRNYIAAKLIEEIVECMVRYVESGFETFVDDWLQFDVLTGRRVNVKTDQEELEGHVIGFNKDHSVIVRVGNEEKTYYAADIKLKLDTHVNG
ncbi:MAG: biotin--[acetyl-CoA-carboxylase] ligase [Gammaproteobacteria bacterium]|nr:biotin--[acetyl-CoA-carboxylase] ligase [Gammaproteobacteria bacterium]